MRRFERRLKHERAGGPERWVIDMQDMGVLAFFAYVLGLVVLWAVQQFPVVFIGEALLGMLASGTSKKWWIRGSALVLAPLVGVAVIMTLDPWSGWPEHSELDIRWIIGLVAFAVAGFLATAIGVLVGHFMGRD